MKGGVAAGQCETKRVAQDEAAEASQAVHFRVLPGKCGFCSESSGCVCVLRRLLATEWSVPQKKAGAPAGRCFRLPWQESREEMTVAWLDGHVGKLLGRRLQHHLSSSRSLNV